MVSQEVKMYTSLLYCLCPVQLERPTEVVEPLKDVTAKEKTLITLSCRFSSPPKEVRWYKGETLLVASQKYCMKQEAAQVQLTISDLVLDDAGEYHCRSGTCESKAVLTVEGKIPYTVAFTKTRAVKLFIFHNVNKLKDNSGQYFSWLSSIQ